MPKKLNWKLGNVCRLAKKGKRPGLAVFKKTFGSGYMRSDKWLHRRGWKRGMTAA